MPGMCTMCLFVFPRWNSKTIPVPWAKRKNGKRYSDSNGQAALMHWFQLWSPQNLSQWENGTNTLQLIWKEDRGDPEYSMCNVCPKSSYLPLIHFVIQCIQSSLSSCDICRHNPALINSLCSCSVFCHTQEKIIKNSHKHRLPPPALSPFRFLPQLVLASLLGAGQVQELLHMALNCTAHLRTLGLESLSASHFVRMQRNPFGSWILDFMLQWRAKLFFFF